MVRQVLLVTLALVGAWMPPPATFAQGHHPPGRSLREALIPKLRLLGLTIEPGASPATLSTILTLSEPTWRHASRGRAAWREQALPRRRSKAHLRVPHLVDRLIWLARRVLQRRLLLVTRQQRRCTRLLPNIKDALPLPLLRLMLDDGLPQRRLPVDGVEPADRLVEQFVVHCIQMVDYLIATVSQGDHVALLALRRVDLGVVRQDDGVGQALEALGVEVLLIAKDDGELLEEEL